MSKSLGEDLACLGARTVTSPLGYHKRLDPVPSGPQWSPGTPRGRPGQMPITAKQVRWGLLRRAQQGHRGYGWQGSDRTEQIYSLWQSQGLMGEVPMAAWGDSVAQ